MSTKYVRWSMVAVMASIALGNCFTSMVWFFNPPIMDIAWLMFFFRLAIAACPFVAAVALGLTAFGIWFHRIKDVHFPN